MATKNDYGITLDITNEDAEKIAAAVRAGKRVTRYRDLKGGQRFRVPFNLILGVCTKIATISHEIYIDGVNTSKSSFLREDGILDSFEADDSFEVTPCE